VEILFPQGCAKTSDLKTFVSKNKHFTNSILEISAQESYSWYYRDFRSSI
jgi:hypothetical protein